ncbi:MAG: T9SS type A sorting domain-containing protein [Bacteroidetes bacterium]|nr:MAG: T9SS type A sorting domain-containing protein [Bacteroidota bacterium]
MKARFYILYTILLFSNFQLFAQIPDGSFNNWTTNSIGRLDLQDWITGNLDYSLATILQDVGQSGSGYSPKFVSVYDSSVGYYQGGYVQLTQVPFTGTIRPNSLLGYWKTYNPSNSDIVLADVQIYNSGMVEIGSGAKQTPFNGSLSAWTAFSIPITYTTSDSAAYFSMRISWTNFGGNPAGYANVDDIHFDISTAVVESAGDLSGIKLSAIRPGYFELTSSLNSPDNFTVQLFDLSGKQILGKKTLAEVNGQSQTILDLSQMASGIYFCNVFSKTDYRTFKIVNY